MANKRGRAATGQQLSANRGAAGNSKPAGANRQGSSKQGSRPGGQQGGGQQGGGQQGGGRQGAGAQSGANRQGGPGGKPGGPGGKPGGPGGRSSGQGRPSGQGKAVGQGKQGASRNGQAGGGRPRQPVVTAQAPAARPAPRLWFQLTTLIVSLVGLGVSVYLTIAHFTTSAVLLCPANSFINCGEVTTSPESEVFGILPVAVLGLAFYVFMVAVNTPWAWQWQAKLPAIRWARIGSVVVGMGFVLYLIYAELIQIGKICEYCTLVHLMTFILFVLIIFNATSSSERQASSVGISAERPDIRKP